MATTFLKTECNAWITPEISISNYSPDTPTGVTVKKVTIEPNKIYHVIYFDPSTSEVLTINGVFRKAIVRADIISSGMVDLVTTGCPNLIETLVFDHSENNVAKVKLLDISNIRDISPLLT